MANIKDCAVCKQMMKKKHKADKFYRIGFWVVLVLLVVFATLYFATGDVFRYTENRNADVYIENDGGENNNNIDIQQ